MPAAPPRPRSRRASVGRAARSTIAVDAGRISREDLAVGARDLLPVGRVDDEHARADDVGEARPRLLERVADELEAEAHLVVRALRRLAFGGIGAVPATWTGRPATSAREIPHDLLLGRVPRDEAALHATASIARRGGAPPDRGVAGGARRRRRRHGGGGRRRARRHAPAASAGLGDEAARSPTRRSSRPRRARSTSTSRPAPRARPSAICSHMRPASRWTRRRRSAARASAGSTRTRGSTHSPPTSKPARRCRSRGISTRPCSGRSRSAPPSTATPRPAWRRRSATCSASGGSCSHRRSLRPRRSPRRRRSSSRASTACCPGFGRVRRRTTGDSGSSSAMRSRRTGRGRCNSPATFGHFGSKPQRHLPLGRSRAAARVRRAHRREFGDWAREAWPRLSDAVLSEGSRAAAG